MYFGNQITGVVRQLLFLNIVMFIGTYVVLGEANSHSLGRLYLAAFMPGSVHFEPFQIATHMFMHGDIGHLAFNMLSLYMFGPMVEMIMGPKKFLTYYILCGLGSYVLHTGVQWFELQGMGVDPTTWNGPMLGASGAIFGIYVAFGFLFPNQIISLLFPPVSLKAKYLVIIMTVAELFFGIKGVSTGIAHYAHLGGALMGFIILLIWYRGRLRF